MKYPIPSPKETKIIINVKVRKAAKHRGRAAIEAIKANLEAIERR